MALQIPMFHTHHAPVGAWASLTFGSPSKGVSIDLENPEVKDSGTLLFGMANGQEVHTIGFTERQKTEGGRYRRQGEAADERCFPGLWPVWAGRNSEDADPFAG